MLITLNDFIGFVGKTESRRRKKVLDVISRMEKEYAPEKDYWKKMRTVVKKFQKSGSVEPLDLYKALQKLNPKKYLNYKAAVEGYEKFFGSNNPIWFEPISKDWEHGELLIKVNPDMGLRINGEKHLVKLYFSQEKLSVESLAVIFELMRASLNEPPGAKISLLKVRDSRLLTMGESDPRMIILLKKEAEYFVELWKKLKVTQVTS